MKITKQRTNPTAATCVVDGVQFVATFETLKNDTNGHPRRAVAICWNSGEGWKPYSARAFVIVLNYESEQEAAEQLARRIVDSWKK